MSRPVVLDSLAFGRAEGSLRGTLLVGELTRLFDLLTDQTGRLEYRLTGRIGSRNRSQVLLEVGGVLCLRCQRCLEAIEYPLELRSLLEFVDSDRDLTQEELEDDSRDFLPNQKELDVAVLVEDEILLALPTAPRHKNCVLPGGERGAAKVLQFSVLADLRGKPDRF